MMHIAAGLRNGRKRSRLRPLLEGALGVPFTEGNRIEVLRNGIEIFPAMLDAIKKARHTIEFLTFVYWGGQIAQDFANTLAARARDGIEVLVLLDGFGAAKMDKRLIRRMRSAGAKVEWFRPLPRFNLHKDNHRTHRKLLICDGSAAFTGGVGIAEEWIGDARGPDEWRDTHFRVSGPAVRHMKAAFLGNWIETGRPLLDLERHIDAPKPAGAAAIQVVRSTASVGWNDTATLLKVMFAYAQARIWISTGFFVVDDRTQQLLINAARRGTDVRIMYPGVYHDSRVSKLAGERKLRPLLNAGIQIYRYQKSMLHTKIMLIDDSFAAVGSTNLNQRSLLKDDEVSLAVDDPGTATILRNHFELDMRDCTQAEPRQWRRRSPVHRLGELIAAPLQRQT